MEEKQRAALRLLVEQPARVGRWCGFELLSDELHNGWIRRMMLSPESFTLQAHRSSYKTTCLSVALACIMVTQPKKNVLFFRKGDDDVIEIVRQVRRVLESPAMCQITEALYGDPARIIRGNASELTTDCYATPRGSAQLVGIGTGGSITGKHADIIVTDDIVNLKDRVSRAERNRIKGIYMELANILNPGGRMINTGTPWHKDDAFSLMPNIVRYDCYQTGILTPDQIKERKAAMTPSLFAANYELRHIAEEDVIFGEAQYADDPELACDGFAHVDAAYGGGDGTAFTIARKRGENYYLYGRLWNKHVDQCLDEMFSAMDNLRAGKIYCEDNGDKGYLAKEMRKRGRRVQPYHEAMNKFVKVTTYLKAAWPNVYFVPGTDPEYIAQILDYNENAEHDDAPDSAASLIRRQYWKHDENAALPGEAGAYWSML